MDTGLLLPTSFVAMVPVVMPPLGSTMPTSSPASTPLGSTVAPRVLSCTTVDPS